MWIAFLLDACVILLVVIMIVFGMKKGFFASLIGLISSLLSVFAAALLTGPVSTFVYENAVHGMLQSNVAGYIESNVTLPAGAAVSQFIDAMVEALRGMSIPFINLGQVTAEDLGVNAASMEEVATNLVNNVIGPQVQALLNIVVFVVLFLILGILVRVVAKALSRTLNMLPLVGTANRLLGGVLGACKGIILCYLLVTVLKLLMNYFGTGFPITPATMELSKLAGFLYRYTIL